MIYLLGCKGCHARGQDLYLFCKFCMASTPNNLVEMMCYMSCYKKLHLNEECMGYIKLLIFFFYLDILHCNSKKVKNILH